METRQLFSFTVRISTPTARRWDLIRSLGALLESTRVEPGCLRTGLFADLGEPNWIELVEEWESREAFERQMASDKLRTLIAAIDHSEATPAIHFDLIHRDEGVETLNGAARLLWGKS